MVLQDSFPTNVKCARILTKQIQFGHLGRASLLRYTERLRTFDCYLHLKRNRRVVLLSKLDSKVTFPPLQRIYGLPNSINRFALGWESGQAS